MELLLSLLIGLLFWLLLFHWGRSRGAAVCSKPQGRCCGKSWRLRAVRWWRRSAIGAGIVFALASIGYAGLLLFLQHSAKTPSFVPIFEIVLDIRKGLNFTCKSPSIWPCRYSVSWRRPASIQEPWNCGSTAYCFCFCHSLRHMERVAECHWISPKSCAGCLFGAGGYRGLSNADD